MGKELRFGFYIIGLIFILSCFLFLAPRLLSLWYQTRGGIQIEQALRIDKVNPSNRIACEHRIARQTNQGKLASAVSSLQKALAYDDGNDQAFLMLGRSYCYLNDYKSAIGPYINYTKLRPDNPLGHLELGFAYEASANENAAIEEWKLAGTTVQDFLALARSEKEAEQRLIAIDWYQRAVLLNPSSDEAWLGLGRLNEDLHGSDYALQFYWKAWNLNRENSTSELSLALMNQGDYQTVESILQQVITDYPDSPKRYTWWQNLARAYEERKLWDRAIEVYQSAIAEFPSDASLHIFLGWDYYELDRNSELAIKEFQQAIKLNTKSADGYYAMGQIFSKDGQYEEADNWYAKAIKRNSERPWYYVSRANNIRNTGNYNSAIQLYQEALTRFPDCSSCYLNLAITYRLNNQPDETLTAIQKALSLADPPDEDYFVIAGEIYEWLYQYEEAREVFQEALTLNPNNETAIDGLGRLNQK